MVNVETDSSMIFSLMAAQKVLIRQGSEWDHPNWIRVNPGKHPEENEIFINAFKNSLNASKPYRDINSLLSTAEGLKGARIGYKHGLIPLSRSLSRDDYRKLLRAIA